MSYFAKIEQGIVTEVISAEQDFIDTLKGQWVQTSYNTRNGIHYDQDGNPDGGIALRYRYAGIGYVYDEINDVFYTQKPYQSWSLNQTNWTWKAPTPRPNDDKFYNWNESTLNWDLI